MFLVTLDFRFVHLATDQTLGVKDSVFRVGVEGILGGITDTVEMRALSERHSPVTGPKEDSQPFLIGEGYP